MSIFDIFKKKAKAQKRDNGEVESLLLSLGRQEIVMEVDRKTKSVSPGASKIGGRPWLPRDFEWPSFTDANEGETRPLSFLCQIDLADVKRYDAEGALPDRGMLYFFYECESFCWGFDPEDNGCARVFYFENTENFTPTELPEGIAEEYLIPEMAVKFKAQKSYPSYEELDLYADIDCDWDDYDEILTRLGADTESEHHKLLGYADVIQSEMLTDCERVSRGLYCGNPESYASTPADEEVDIQSSAKDWTLLLQLSTLTKGDWELMWGDCGMLYFYIRKQDLAEKRFENVWFSLQCG